MPWPYVYLGLALTTSAALILELAITRIFSVVFYYHFAFLAISIALFGLGAGGIFSYLAARSSGTLFSKLGVLSVLNSLAVVGCLAFLLSRRGDPGYWTLAGVYFLSALPFFFSGVVISLVISEGIKRIGRVYFFDLLGAGAGCLALIPLLNTLGGPNTVLAAAVLYAAAAAVWFSQTGQTKGRAVSAGLALALVALVILNVKVAIIDVRFAKGRALKDERFVKWNSFSRVALAPDPVWNGLSIVIDADASTGIPRYDLDNLSPKDRQDLLYKGPGLPYLLRPGAKTLVIGAGGGYDIARALASGSRDVTGVEINPIIARTIMRERFPDLSRRLYFRPEVRLVIEDGRRFVRRTRERYQVIQATLVDTWAATVAGAFALSENSLYTVEAFRDYLSHLTPDGVLAFTRWGLEPPRESLRLVTLATEALKSLGQREPPRHIAVLREGTEKDLAGWGATDTILIARLPFSPDDLTRLRRAARAAGLHLLYLPGDSGANAFARLLTASDPRTFQRTYPYDISPVTDDRPFFFYTVQPRDLWEFVKSASRRSADYKINRAVPLLFSLVGVSVAATALILSLPPLVFRRRLPREKGVPAFLLYFVAIGAGYIIVQVALIQKLVLFLGHPTYALTVVIFTMLIASGAGSLLSGRIVALSIPRLSSVLASGGAIVILLAWVIPVLGEAAVAWPFGLKVILTAVLVAAPAFWMGMPFPTGLALLELRHRSSVKLAWSLNAAASVMGSVLAIVMAIYGGLRLTLVAGGALYFCALLILRLALARHAARRPVSSPAVALTGESGI
jgi:hypothetical protein